MPYADAIYPAWRTETNNYMNIKPQNCGFNRGAWKSLEQAIRNKAIGTSKTLEVYTGSFDLSGHLNETKLKVQVHNLWYKIVINNSEGIVFVACNDEKESCITELYEICPNICIKIGWLTKKTQSKIICCSLNDFYKSRKIAVIPGTIGVTENMSFHLMPQ